MFSWRNKKTIDTFLLKKKKHLSWSYAGLTVRKTGGSCHKAVFCLRRPHLNHHVIPLIYMFNTSAHQTAQCTEFLQNAIWCKSETDSLVCCELNVTLYLTSSTDGEASNIWTPLTPYHTYPKFWTCSLNYVLMCLKTVLIMQKGASDLST